MHRGRGNPHSAYCGPRRGCNSPCSTCASHIEAVTSDVEDVTSLIEAVTAYIECVTAHMAPVTMKPPFEPTAAAAEKIAKPFLGDYCYVKF